jgi:glutathione synthase/RimK-type ligase-like ATP-grasp enzyme
MKVKKIGLLFGRENTFPPALAERINSKKIPGIVAEAVQIDKVIQADPTEYAVILDRISQDVPFYRAFLKNAALCGTAVLNNPFWWSADEKFFNNCLMEKAGLTMPKTVLMPSNQRPNDTYPESFRNLKMPLDYGTIFKYVGFPAFFKPFDGGGWKNVYKIHDEHEFFRIYNQTGQLVMILQENIDFSLYFRCYCLGGKNVHIMPYDPKAAFHERYVREKSGYDPKLLKRVEEMVITINQMLGYDFNTVEIAMRGDNLYPIDFCNPAPDCDNFSVGEDNFEWILENAANLCIERAQAHKEGQMNLTWGKFVHNSVAGANPVEEGKKSSAKKEETSEEAPKKAASKKK